MSSVVKKFVRDERGLESVEYAVLLALIVVGLVVAVRTLGGTIRTKFEEVNAEIAA